jgi:hypothetical protein
MKAPPLDRKVLRAILTGTYSPRDLHEFVQLCYSIVLPTVRKKISLGKINLDIVGLREEDIVHDCLADLFYREDSPAFPQIVKFFEKEVPSIDQANDERLLRTLRRLVLSKVNNNIIRLYAEVDPVLGKILRNLTHALDRLPFFERQSRFGEAYLVAVGVEPLSHLPPIPMDEVRDRFAAKALIHDTIPQMMKKLHEILAEQCEHHRAVPVVAAALLFKEVYALGSEQPEQQLEQLGEGDDIPRIIDRVAKQFETEMHKVYVESGKKSAQLLEQYMLALKQVLTGAFARDEGDSASYFDYLKQRIPRLTEENYAKKHRTAFEYMAKKAKERVRRELRNM